MGYKLFVKLRPSVGDIFFDAPRFESLRQELRSGALDLAAARLAGPPAPLGTPPRDLRHLDADARNQLRTRGEDALREGRIAALVLNGGMATRFGGGAKGVVSVVDGHPNASFLAIKLADVRARAARLGASIPLVVMNSFATRSASLAHLTAIDWSGVPDVDRYHFNQSILPRIRADGTPLMELGASEAWPDTAVYTAPGHGDTIEQFRRSGLVDRLHERGVEHVLVSNVDNLGASLDPLLAGAHLQAVREGASLTVEVVERQEGDAGGAVALHPETGRPAIIEGFRLPEGVDLSHYPHFNTNTLWFRTDALAAPLDLQWFPVRKAIRLAGQETPIIQFERLIGQASELLDTNFVVVDRSARFLPIKTRDELQTHSDRLRRYAHGTGVVP